MNGIAVSVRPMLEDDLMESRRIFQLAFGTFIGVPDPEQFGADREYIFTRWRANPEAAFVAEINGAIAGSNFAANWGSFGFFGPLTVRPDLWNQRIARRLLDRTMDLFDEWRLRETGLFTFPHSPKHIGLYQRYGFWPRFLTAILSKSVSANQASALRFSAMSPEEREQALSACRKLTDSIYEGLDVSSEIESVSKQKLGDTLFVWEGDRLDAIAVCHCGERSEAGNGNCYIKFAAARPGSQSEKHFDRLLDSCEALASEHGLTKVEAGVNLGRSLAYRRMLEKGFRADIIGVAMHRPDTAGYNRPENFVLDDWR